MTTPVKQHLIDPEICIRCYTCEMTCPIGAIEHDDNNVVVNADVCNFCMDCIPVCPTGSIDEWRVVETPYTLEEQYEFDELPEQAEIEAAPAGGDGGEADPIAALLAEAHKGAGGKARAPLTAAKPAVNMYTLGKPAKMKVQGNYRLTDDPSHDVRHIILDPGALPFPVLEGQSVGIIPPGQDAEGKAHLPRLYSVSSPRDGERPGYHNISLTVKREDGGLASNYLCDLEQGSEVEVTGPFGSTFLMPNDPNARLLLICTGTGSAPMRAFTMQRQRGGATGGMTMFFGARTPESLPYFGPLKKIPEKILRQHLVFSRLPDADKEYVQDRIVSEQDEVAEMLGDDRTHIYICGLRGMEEGVELAMTSIAESIGQQWTALRDVMRDEGRYHVETY
ncbi:benzoyl-CoA 2,3-epoxidase subunit BoxA [Sulfitobacter mediterraneus]|uniref:benzoyl-CoA 2,3-epoxidase subunit BoxA n=1 Tax=Sulfitobacter mediterraneus TaxID=83219 RepID=UPI001933FF0E|nr:benzoyl-CoA 2,3-epoxidase subunit BoxA [Sulfitobacter mediterraneus]MBM1310058.1 benzoyl-CoA 2,3-epoxidase subunit BoxA [Sulfitobacter mediterraneus]MBM1313942.1 benzoyl-CoA 2,3-epoxidase subunit BoxA [Sulfitobacter mediterraneus]MBM1322302.1 benzoyl-CoA 2,3-epoxidase subunit BoxA [Sulfitobacter mediterraneus]MBM1326214.1 benzoyl-CoA 2,3-epoxidase subunit BoxA [Sulfitobacter mediterraneus]MBM1397560.1 benzoyl-CoA 2,3-epoxidase subunit BoxA [Sulfitobacter mediterraneus]